MPEAKAERDEPDYDPLAEDALDRATLERRGDIDGLLALAKAHRNGTAPGGRDLEQCLAAYRAASGLGSADAEYAVALFFMAGGVVKQDVKEGASRLRVAAERGSVAAKVYLGNLYELGILYKADPEKADVWYRNAARGAGVESEPGTDAYDRQLGELGCARYAIALAEAESTSAPEKARLLQRARAHGYGLKVRDEASERGSRPSAGAAHNAVVDPSSALEPSLEALRDVAPRRDEPAPLRRDEAPGAPSAAAAGPDEARNAEPRDASQKRAARTHTPSRRKDAATNAPRFLPALGAFAYALVFAIAGLGAAYAATLGARELVVRGTLLPGLGTRAHLVFPIVLFLVGVLPAGLVYRAGTMLKGLAVGALFGAIGWVAWGTGQAAFLALRQLQAMTFGLSGFLAAVFVLGLLEGTKRHPRRTRVVGRSR